MIDETIIEAECTETGFNILSLHEELLFCGANLGKKVLLSAKLASDVSEKDKLFAYYYKVIVPRAVIGYTDSGYEGMDKVSADYMLSAELLKGYVKDPDGNYIPTVISKSTITKDRLYKFVTDCIHIIESRFGLPVPDASEYLESIRSNRKLKKAK